jgi:hypothetical protein
VKVMNKIIALRLSSIPGLDNVMKK